MRDLDLVSYILYRTRCEHPFRLSRILLLLDWMAEDRLGGKLTKGLGYKAMGFGFQVDGLEEILKELEKMGRAKMNLALGCIEYLGEPPKIPEKVRELVDEVVAKTLQMDDLELNYIIVKDPRYSKWIS